MGKTLPFRLNDANMLSRVRSIAADTSRIFIEKHAKARMRKRRISITQIYECLRKGHLTESAHIAMRGGWKCTMTYRWAGDEISVPLVIEQDEKGDWIAVITVF